MFIWVIIQMGEVEEQEHKTDKYDKLMAFQP